MQLTNSSTTSLHPVLTLGAGPVTHDALKLLRLAANSSAVGKGVQETGARKTSLTSPLVSALLSPAASELKAT